MNTLPLSQFIFPDPIEADPDGHGLICIGADLSPSTLYEAYTHGLFPWFNEDEPICWWSPEPRCVIYPQNYKPSKSLLRNMKNMIIQLRLIMPSKKLFAHVLYQEVMQMKLGLVKILFRAIVRCLMLAMDIVWKSGIKTNLSEVYTALRLAKDASVNQCLVMKLMFQKWLFIH